MDFSRKWNGNEAIKTKRHCFLWQSGTFDKSQLSEPIDVPAGCIRMRNEMLIYKLNVKALTDSSFWLFLKIVLKLTLVKDRSLAPT